MTNSHRPTTTLPLFHAVEERAGERRSLSRVRHRVVKDLAGRLVPFAILMSAANLAAQPFQLPTANRAIFEKGGEDKFFAATVGKTWVSGTFGCVRSDGWQIHEGLDIRSVQRDKRGEPTDPVMAT